MSSILARIGTRGSPLALWQANEVRTRLAEAMAVAAERIEIVAIRTTGDAIQDRPLSEAGGKGLFTKEIDQALIDGRVDLAVHSAKDLPTELAGGTGLAACLPRADVRDALIFPKGRGLADLPQGAVVGTASLRRGALLRRVRPDLRIETLRGNVGTRLGKIEAGLCDATLLALAGLQRLGLEDHATEILGLDIMPPALGQGTIAITARDADILDSDGHGGALAAIDARDAHLALVCERAFLTELDGSCRMPIAGLALVDADNLCFSGIVLSPDGSFAEQGSTSGAAEEAAILGAACGRELHARLPAGFLQNL